MARSSSICSKWNILTIATGADPEEQDSQGLTALHVALLNGRVAAVSYFFQAYPPKESDSARIYRTPSSHNLLSLAIESNEPELVWMIFDKHLAPTQDINSAWAAATDKLTTENQREGRDQEAQLRRSHAASNSERTANS